MFRSLRWRIAITFVLLNLITLTGLGVYLTVTYQKIQLNKLKSQLAAEASLAASSLVPYFQSGAEPAKLDALARQWSAMLTRRITILSAAGEVLGESHAQRAEMDNHLQRLEIQEALRTGAGSSIRYSNTVEYEMIYYAVPVRVDQEIVGFVRISFSLKQFYDELAALKRTFFALGFFVAAVDVVFAIWVSNYTIYPIRQLTQAVEAVAAQATPIHLTPTTNDEVGQLTQAFNAMSFELRRQIEALETEKQKTSAVLAGMTDGVLIIDSTGRIQLINPTVKKIFNLGEKDALNRPLMEVLRNHMFVELWQRCTELNETQTTAIEIPHQRLFLIVTATPLGGYLPGSILMIINDLTPIRRLETVRRDFISNISHELRTPLASLKALTETLQETALDDPPAARRFLQRMETEVDAISLMVSELLELSRIESGRVPLQLRRCDPAEIIQGTVERLRLQAERAGLHLHIDAAPGLPFVLADAMRLEQVLVNLLHNAIKFTPSGGSITLAAQAQPSVVLFSVQDTGIGIPAEEIGRIFERFYKADRSRSSRGTGLGLAIARHLVEAHGGRIWVESVENQGSTFYFTIPQAQPESG